MSGRGRGRAIALTALACSALFGADLLAARSLINRATPVSIHQAVTRYRALVAAVVPPPVTRTVATAAAARRPVRAPRGPSTSATRISAKQAALARGVYSYTTKGSEAVTILGGARHDYPARSAVTLTSTPCGDDLSWQPIEQRREVFGLCDAGRTIQLARLVSYHDFFGQAKTDRFVCTDTVLRPASDAPGTPVGGRCAGANGTVVLSGFVVGDDTVVVGSSPIPALHIHIAGTLAGANRGSRSIDIWFASNNLELRYDSLTDATSDTPLGATHYTEKCSLKLDSLTPQQ